MGPTACGKTELAVSLVKACKLDIISVDSALVYSDMNIGTAKPDRQTLAVAPHRLINLIDPAQHFSVADFCQQALAAIQAIHSEGKIPLLVGGTMMYFRALQHGLSELPEANAEVRVRIDRQASEIGWAAMHAKLAQIDPQSAKKIHHNDPQRIQRALEVYEITGKSLSKLKAENPKHDFPYDVFKMVVLYQQRQHLAEPIRQRFLKMLDSGFVEEVKALKARGDLSLQLPSMRCVGYRQIWEHLSGVISFQQMIDNAVKATKQLAKRQYTWLRLEEAAHKYYLELGNPTERILEKVRQFIYTD